MDEWISGVFAASYLKHRLYSAVQDLANVSVFLAECEHRGRLAQTFEPDWKDVLFGVVGVAFVVDNAKV